MTAAALPLRERKQRRTRDAIIATAYALFAERGFAGVTVDDIAERAEVGRTTLFRYFGDKQEIVFADDEQIFLELTTELRAAEPEAIQGLAAALRYMETIVVRLCSESVREPKRYRAQEQLLRDNPELQDRHTRKLQRYAGVMAEILRERGTDPGIATLAGQVAVACYYTGRLAAGTHPKKLVPGVESAFQALADR